MFQVKRINKLKKIKNRKNLQTLRNKNPAYFKTLFPGGGHQSEKGGVDSRRKEFARICHDLHKQVRREGKSRDRYFCFYPLDGDMGIEDEQRLDRATNTQDGINTQNGIDTDNTRHSIDGDNTAHCKDIDHNIDSTDIENTRHSIDIDHNTDNIDIDHNTHSIDAPSTSVGIGIQCEVTSVTAVTRDPHVPTLDRPTQTLLPPEPQSVTTQTVIMKGDEIQTETRSYNPPQTSNGDETSRGSSVDVGSVAYYQTTWNKKVDLREAGDTSRVEEESGKQVYSVLDDATIGGAIPSSFSCNQQVQLITGSKGVPWMCPESASTSVVEDTWSDLKKFIHTCAPTPGAVDSHENLVIQNFRKLLKGKMAAPLKYGVLLAMWSPMTALIYYLYYINRTTWQEMGILQKFWTLFMSYYYNEYMI